MMAYIHIHHVIMDSIQHLMDVIQNPAEVSRNTSFRGLSNRPLAANIVCLSQNNAKQLMMACVIQFIYFLLYLLHFFPFLTCIKDLHCDLINISFCCLCVRQCVQCKYNWSVFSRVHVRSSIWLYIWVLFLSKGRLNIFGFSLFFSATKQILLKKMTLSQGCASC